MPASAVSHPPTPAHSTGVVFFCSPEGRLQQRRRRGGSYPPDEISCRFQQRFHFIIRGRRWRITDQQRGAALQNTQPLHAGIEKPAALTQPHTVVHKGIRQVQQQCRSSIRRGLSQQGRHLVAGESARNLNPLQGGLQLGGAPAQRARQTVSLKRIAAVQHAHRSAGSLPGSPFRKYPAQVTPRSFEQHKPARHGFRKGFHTFRIAYNASLRHPPFG